MKNNDIARYLCCPICGSTVYASHASIDCSAGYRTGHSFPMRDGVPDMLPGRQKVSESVKDTYDYKWHNLPQYGYDKASEKFRYDWYMKRYNWTEEQLKDFLGKCKLILDVGTGLGSQVMMYAGMTKGDVFGVDISDSVYTAAKYQAAIPNTHFIQADLGQLPFPRGSFDFIVSDQVLHHTPDTELAVRSLIPLLKTGGQIAFYVYKRKGELREKCDDFLRQYTTRMSEEDCLKFSEIMTRLGRDLSSISVEFQRTVYWEMLKCFWNPDMDYDTNVMINFDWYRPKYAWRHTSYEVRCWLRDAKLDVLYLDEGDSGISVRAQKN